MKTLIAGTTGVAFLVWPIVYTIRTRDTLNAVASEPVSHTRPARMLSSDLSFQSSALDDARASLSERGKASTAA